MKKALKLMILFFIAFTLISCGSKQIKVTKDAGDYVGLYYTEVVEELKNSGFTDVTETPIDDITSQSSITDGAVESVTIGDNNAFSANDKFDPTSKVIVTYHNIPKINPPFDNSEMVNSNFEDVVAAFSDAGFTNVIQEEVADLDPDESEKDSLIEVLVNGSSKFVKTDKLPFDAEIKCILHRVYVKYDVNIKINFIGNWIFSKYDVECYFDDDKLGQMEHGNDDEYSLRTKEGTHNVIFKKVDDSSVTGQAVLEVDSNIDVAYTIYCHSDRINVDIDSENHKYEPKEDETRIPGNRKSFLNKNYEEIVNQLKEAGFTNIETQPVYNIEGDDTQTGVIENITVNGEQSYEEGDIFKKTVAIVITYRMKVTDDPNYVEPEVPEEEPEVEEETKEKKEEKASENKDNDSKKERSADSGVYAYKTKGSEYQIYIIIDFDEKYVYRFSTEDSTCERVKIDKGDLNSGLYITYHDGGDEWQEVLHWKYVDQDAHLIHNDYYGFETDFYETDVSSAISMRNKKTMHDY